MASQQSYNFEDCKSQILSAQEEISGELVPVAQYMVEQYESQIDEYKDKLKKNKVVFICAIIAASASIIGWLSNQSAVSANINTKKEQDFSEALKKIGSKKEQDVIDSIGVIGRSKDEIFKIKPEMQWQTVIAITSAIKGNSVPAAVTKKVVKGKSITIKPKFAILMKYGFIRKENVQKLINIIKFENEKSGIKGRPEDDSGIVDLSETYLDGIDLSKAQLSRTNFNRSILENSTITDADLTGSFFTGTSLKNADMSRSNLTKASLNKFGDYTTNLIGVSLTDTDLKDANLRGAKLSHPNPQSQSVSIGKIKKARNLDRASFDREISKILDQ